MAIFHDTRELMSFTFSIVLILLTANRALQNMVFLQDGEDAEEASPFLLPSLWEPILEFDEVMAASLYNSRLCNVFSLLADDLGFWVKPRSTTWFTKFLLEQYDDARWIQMFRMTKPAVFALADLLRPHIQRNDTKYRLAVPVLVRLACTLFKLTHGASFLICSELFAMGKSTVCIVLRQVVRSINEVLRQEIMWPTGQRVLDMQADFFQLCGLPAIVGAIDCTHIAIAKPKFGVADYYYFKWRGYTINCQAVVDTKKRFLDLFLGMPGSTNDARVLRRSSLYHLARHNNLFDARYSVAGFPPYLLGHSCYPLLPWLMVPHTSPLTIAETLYNRRQKRGRCIVENAFGMLKQTFRELLGKSILNVSFLPDVIVACAILHNVLLGQSHEDVQRLLDVLRTEGFPGEVVHNDTPILHATTEATGGDLDRGG